MLIQICCILREMMRKFNKCNFLIHLGLQPLSFSTYHSVFVESYLNNIRKVDTILWGSCNAGVIISVEKGLLFGIVDMLINKKGITNLLSAPQLYEDVLCVTYDTYGE